MYTKHVELSRPMILKLTLFVTILISIWYIGDRMFGSYTIENTRGEITQWATGTSPVPTNFIYSVEQKNGTGITEDQCYKVAGVATTTKEGVYVDSHNAYNLFVQTTEDIYQTSPESLNPCPPTFPVISYIEEGTVESGAYAGYHRIVGFRTYDGPGGDIPTPFFFITKDYVTYLLVTHDLSTAAFPGGSTESEVQTQSVLSYVNKKKVTGVVKGVLFPHPTTLTKGIFTYRLGRLHTEIPTGSHRLDTIQGLEVWDTTYREPLVSVGAYGYGLYGTSTEKEQKRREEKFAKAGSYYTGSTEIKVKDRSGIVADYELEIPSVNSKKVTTSFGILTTKEEYQGLLYGKDIQSKEKLYVSYKQVTPPPCGVSPSAHIAEHILPSDVRKIGTHDSGIDLYVLVDKKHPILEAQYIEKVDQYDKETFLQMNSRTGVKKMPTYDEYTASNPVLLFKDAWGRFVIVGEYEYMIEGGCGKPVIYLYPKTTTDINIQFKNPTLFTVDIPKYDYQKGWNIRAQSNGVLTDLSPENTDCELLNYSTKSRLLKIVSGSEYAHEACVHNQYPYIYWAGNTEGVYPKKKEGFVVRKDQIGLEITKQMYHMGFSEKETSDMLAYWQPYLLHKNAPYYRLSFIQTAEMNRFIPMKVIPQPDSVLRMFLDWEPLEEKVSIEPQNIVPVKREGFVYVEWGGLKF
jgi:hypothetical protein